MFHGSSQFTITSSQLAINHITGPSSGIDMLYHESNHEASYDSSARDPPPRCRPGTRDRHIENIISWTSAPVNETLLWVKGEGRVGKTAIAQTCVEKLKTVGTPLGAFFFSKRNNRHQQFFPTIAYQLSTEFPEYQTLLDAKIRRDRSLLYHKTMASQFKGLILEPFQELERARKGTNGRIPIFVDALDECDNIAAQSQIIELVAAAAEDRTHTFCWVFFTRPKAHIEVVFSRIDVEARCIKIVLPKLCQNSPSTISHPGQPVIAARFSPSVATEEGDSDLEHPSPNGNGRDHSNAFSPCFDSSELQMRGVERNPLRPYCSGRWPSEWPTTNDRAKPPIISSDLHCTRLSDVDLHTPGQVHLPVPRARVLPSYVQEPILVAPALPFRSIFIHLQRFLPP